MNPHPPLTALLALALLATAVAGCGGSRQDDPGTIHLDDTPQQPQTSAPPSEPTPEPPPPDEPGELVVGDDACETDADCVPADCCHPAACVHSQNAPACGDAMCTSDCRYGTLDCGGRCLCHEGRCAARLSVQPEIRVTPGG